MTEDSMKYTRNEMLATTHPVRENRLETWKCLCWVNVTLSGLHTVYSPKNPTEANAAPDKICIFIKHHNTNYTIFRPCQVASWVLTFAYKFPSGVGSGICSAEGKRWFVANAYPKMARVVVDVKVKRTLLKKLESCNKKNTLLHDSQRHEIWLHAKNLNFQGTFMLFSFYAAILSIGRELFINFITTLSVGTFRTRTTFAVNCPCYHFR